MAGRRAERGRILLTGFLAGSGRLRQALVGSGRLSREQHQGMGRLIEKVTSMVLLKLKIVRLHSGDCSRWVSCCADKGL